MEGVTINDSKDLKALGLFHLTELQCNIAKPHLLAAIHSDGRDLLERMLIINPQERLRSLFALKRIAMYKDYDFNAVKSKRVFIDHSFCLRNRYVQFIYFIILYYIN